MQVILKDQFFIKCPPKLLQSLHEWKPTILEEAAVLVDVALMINPQWKKTAAEAPQVARMPSPEFVSYVPPHHWMSPQAVLLPWPILQSHPTTYMGTG